MCGMTIIIVNSLYFIDMPGLPWYYGLLSLAA